MKKVILTALPLFTLILLTVPRCNGQEAPTAEPVGDAVPAPVLEHFCDLVVELDPTWELGQGRAGRRRIIPIIGGTVSGKAVNGKILDVGADWQTILADGTAELVARYAFETEDGAIIEIVNYGFRHGPPEVLAAMARGEAVPPTAYYMRTQARLETGHPKYQWVNNKLFVGTGGKVKDKVFIALYEIK